MSEDRPVRDESGTAPVSGSKNDFSFDAALKEKIPIDTVPREAGPPAGEAGPQDPAPVERPTSKRVPRRDGSPVKAHPREAAPEEVPPEGGDGPEAPPAPRKAKREKKSRGPGVLGMLAALNPIASAAVAAVAVIALVLGLSWYLGSLNGMKNGIGDSFSKNKDAKAAEVRENIYTAGYGRGFEENHVENVIAIRIDEVRETGRLQIMRVRSSAYVIDDGAEDVSWLKAVGEGVYTVDLTAGEYITDTPNRYVLVRVPSPELTDVTLVSTEQLHYRNNRLIGNGSVEAGEKLAMNQRARALTMLREDLRSNTTVTRSLNDAAQDLISALVRSLNPDIADLTVEVEFF